MLTHTHTHTHMHTHTHTQTHTHKYTHMHTQALSRMAALGRGLPPSEKAMLLAEPGFLALARGLLGGVPGMKPIQVANSMDAFANLGVALHHEAIKVCVCICVYISVCVSVFLEDARASNGEAAPQQCASTCAFCTCFLVHGRMHCSPFFLTPDAVAWCAKPRF